VTGRVTNGLQDTSVLISQESGRRPELDALPANAFISVVTIAELQAGVLAARDTAVWAIRLATLDAVSIMQPLTIDTTAARH
jgi:predicted nucleic acid-binding protein